MPVAETVDFQGAQVCGDLQQMREQTPPHAAATMLGGDAEIEHVRLPGPDADDPVTPDLALHIHDATHIVHAQAVAKDPLGPGECVGGLLDAHHGRQIGFEHAADRDVPRAERFLLGDGHDGS